MKYVERYGQDKVAGVLLILKILARYVTLENCEKLAYF